LQLNCSITLVMDGDNTIPEDLRHLRDFPTFDSTFQDKPNLRQSLHHWVLKTEKVKKEQKSQNARYSRDDEVCGKLRRNVSILFPFIQIG